VDAHRARSDAAAAALEANEEGASVVELELVPLSDEEKGQGDGDGDGEGKRKMENSSFISPEGVPRKKAKLTSPPWWRDVNVRAAIVSQVGCTFVVLCGAEMTPIWMATTIESGGLSWNATEIGAFGTTMGVVILLFQITLFTRLCRKFGIVTLLTYALLANAVAFPLHPLAHVFAERGYGNALEWTVIGFLGLIRGMSGPLIMGGSALILNNSSPRETLGAVNGFVGTFSNMARAVAPLLGGSLVAMMVSFIQSFIHTYF
jgi:hypothetical protein